DDAPAVVLVEQGVVGGDGQLPVAGADDEALALLAQAGPEGVDDQLHNASCSAALSSSLGRASWDRRPRPRLGWWSELSAPTAAAPRSVGPTSGTSQVQLISVVFPLRAREIRRRTRANVGPAAAPITRHRRRTMIRTANALLALAVSLLLWSTEARA